MNSVPVQIVGAGPGDVELLTLRAVEAITRAEVILYDRLIPAEALDYASPGTQLVYVGKTGGKPSMPQAEINTRLIEYARAGKRVVRLKGGDPFVFGRGGEEAEALRFAGIDYEIVPGITSGISAPAYAGIPVTQRGTSTGVAFITGHEDPLKPETMIDWKALAAFPGTLVFYMGLGSLSAISKALIDNGRSASEPAAVIENGTKPNQRTIASTLVKLPNTAREQRIAPPALIVIGEVVSLRNELKWFEQRPLYGCKVAVTRTREQSGELARQLRSLGADVVVTPTIKVKSVPFELPAQPRQLVCFTSPNGVRFFFKQLDSSGLDSRWFGDARIAAIGPGTADELAEYGIKADILPERHVAEGLLAELKDHQFETAMIVRPKQGRTVLEDGLRERNIKVETIITYQTGSEALNACETKKLLDCDYVTFTSGSSVRSLTAAITPSRLSNLRAVSIGPATSHELRQHGLEPTIETDTHSVQGLISTLVDTHKNSAR